MLKADKQIIAVLVLQLSNVWLWGSMEVGYYIMPLSILVGLVATVAIILEDRRRIYDKSNEHTDGRNGTHSG